MSILITTLGKTEVIDELNYVQAEKLLQGPIKVLNIGGGDLVLTRLFPGLKGQTGLYEINSLASDLIRYVFTPQRLLFGPVILTTKEDFKAQPKSFTKPVQKELDFTQGVFTKEEIRKYLELDLRWLERGVLAIYKFQTEEEKLEKDTFHSNGIGFNGADAKYLSYIAEYLKSGKHLSGEHIKKVRHKMLKYSGQLCKIANKEL